MAAPKHRTGAARREEERQEAPSVPDSHEGAQELEREEAATEALPTQPALTVEEGRQLSATCVSHGTCSACSAKWPACAWCGSSGTCRAATPEVLRLGPESQHVIYSAAEYRRSYGFEASVATTDDSCGLWITKPASCQWIAGYCDDNFNQCGNCKARPGCGWCHRPGQQSGCYTGTASSPVRMRSDSEACSSPNSWYFGNWTEWHFEKKWDHSCPESCRRGQAIFTESVGSVWLGNESTQVGYAASADCSWEIRPTDWPRDHLLEVNLHVNVISVRGDLVRLHEALPPVAGSLSSMAEVGSELGYVGCPERPDISCRRAQRIFRSAPAVVTFRSMPRPADAFGGSWVVRWQLVPEDTTTTGGPHLQGEGEPLLWVVTILLVTPVIGLFCCLLWRCRCRGHRARHPSSRAGLGVNIGQLERQSPCCRPRVIGQPAEGEETRENITCSVCLCELEPGDTARGLPCGHNFHRACIDEWLRKNSHCPMCRQPVFRSPRPKASAHRGPPAHGARVGSARAPAAPPPPPDEEVLGIISI